MIILKTDTEIQIMSKACKIAASALKLAGRTVRAGMTTRELDKAIYKYITSCGAKPSFLGYDGFPASACISVNNEVIHGIPGNRVIAEGDIVSIDIGAYYKGFHGDTAATFAVGKVSPEAEKLMDVTKESLALGIRAAIPGNRVGDISNAVQTYVEANGFSVVRRFVGHGVGRNLHEAPEIPHFGKGGRGQRLQAGMTVAIEPMINVKGWDVRVLSDDWTVVTKSGSLSAHYEHTVCITPGGNEIMTLPD